MSDVGKALQTALTFTLPGLLQKAVTDYENFSEQAPPLEAKGFAAHQSACKSSLAHLTAGLKLLTWVDELAASDGTTSDDLEKMISEAEAALARAGRADHATKNPDDGDEN